MPDLPPSTDKLRSVALRRVADKTGLSEAQVAAVLDAASSEWKATAIEMQAGSPSVSPPPAATVSKKFMDAAAWAATAVVVISVGVFLMLVNSFDESRDSKWSALVIGLVGMSISLLASQRSTRSSYALGRQLAWSTFAMAFTLTLWSGMWIAGVWPENTGGDVFDGVTDSSLAMLAFSSVSAVVSIGIAIRERAALAWWIGLGGVFFAGVSALDLASIDLSERDQFVVAIGSCLSLAAVAVWLEYREPAFAPWTYFWAVVMAVIAVAAGPGYGDGGRQFVLTFLIILAVVLGAAYKRGLLIACAAIGGFSLQVWLADSMDPMAVLLTSLLGGLGLIAATVVLWRNHQVVADRLRAILRV